MQLRTFINELKRRNVYRAAVAYAVVGWLLVQIATQVFPFFDVPAWGIRLIVLAIVIGFPFAVAFAWAYEITPEGVKRTEDVAPQRSIASRTGRKLNFIIIGVLTLAVALLVWDRFRSARMQTDDAEKSIAVLPFDNFSENKEDAFFADGIQDDILTSLAKIRDLKVISRTSVMPYRGVGRNLRDIAKALGVTNVLEGSVRRQNDRVLVNVQLMDAINDRHIWADRFDRTLKDAISLQGELATEIAAALKATLSPEEKARVETKPTENAEAYTLLLRARKLQDSADIDLDQMRETERLLNQAVSLDPKSARAHAALAFTIAQIYHEFEPTKARADRALAEAEQALRLDPQSDQAHIAIAHWHYWVAGDYDSALQELAKAEQLAPNNADVVAGMAAIRRRQGRWREALQYFQKNTELDPRNAGAWNELTFTYIALRDWPNVIAASDKMIGLAPNAPTSVLFRSCAEFWQTGDTRRAGELFERLRAALPDGDAATLLQYRFAMLQRDFARARQLAASLKGDRFAVPSGPAPPRAYIEACIAMAQGDREKARPLLENARRALVADEGAASDAGHEALIGVIDAFLGQCSEAVAAGKRATELKSESKDALLGPNYSAELALIYAWCGEKDQAFALVERLLTTPSAANVDDSSITLADLRAHWIWDPLRNDPRFQKLIAGPERPTVY